MRLLGKDIKWKRLIAFHVALRVMIMSHFHTISGVENHEFHRQKAAFTQKKKHALPRRLTTETRISTERLPRGPTPTISQSSARTRKGLRVEMSRAEVLEHPCVCNSSPSLFFLTRPQAAPSAMHQSASKSVKANLKQD